MNLIDFRLFCFRVIMPFFDPDTNMMFLAGKVGAHFIARIRQKSHSCSHVVSVNTPLPVTMKLPVRKSPEKENIHVSNYQRKDSLSCLLFSLCEDSNKGLLTLYHCESDTSLISAISHKMLYWIFWEPIYKRCRFYVCKLNVNDA